MRQRRKPKKLPKKLIFYLAFCLLFLFSSFKLYQDSLWRGQENFNLTIDASENFYLLLINPRNGQLKIVMIPENTYLEVPPEYGFYPLKNVYALGEQELNSGGQLLSLTVSDFLGTPVKGWVKTQGGGRTSGHQLAALILKNVIFKKGSSNLGVIDALRVVFELIRLRPSWLFLEKTLVLTKNSRPDGEIYLEANGLLLDELLVGFFEEKTLREEGKRLAVFNASGFEGLAAKVGRILNNLGCEVVMVSNLSCRQPPCLREDSVILYKDERLKESATFLKIKKLYPFKLTQGGVEGMAVDFSLILGVDFWPKRVKH